jgi:hypothetical protein
MLVSDRSWILRLVFALSINTEAEMDWTKDCPIATPVINEAYGPMRENIIQSVFFSITTVSFSSSHSETSTRIKRVYRFYSETP